MSGVNDGNYCANFNNGIWYALSTRCDMITFSISIFLSQHTGLGNISIFHISFTAHFQYFNISIFQYFQGGNAFVNPLLLLHLGSTSFRDNFLPAMYISNFLSKSAARLRFRAVFGGCYCPWSPPSIGSEFF